MIYQNKILTKIYRTGCVHRRTWFYVLLTRLVEVIINGIMLHIIIWTVLTWRAKKIRINGKYSSHQILESLQIFFSRHLIIFLTYNHLVGRTDFYKYVLKLVCETMIFKIIKRSTVLDDKITFFYLHPLYPFYGILGTVIYNGYSWNRLRAVLSSLQ